MANPTRPTRGERFSTAVVEAVARRVGAEPADLDPPLFAAVDPDALDEVLTSLSKGTGGSVSFHYLGYEVTVHDDGDVELEDSSDPSTGFDSGSMPADE